MKVIKPELDVDFIGNHEGLTPAEEKALSEFFKQRKLAGRRSLAASKQKPQIRPKSTSVRQ